VIVHANELLPRSVVLVAPTSRSARPASFPPAIELLGEPTRVLVEQVGAVDARRLGDLVSRVTPDQQWGIDEALMTVREWSDDLGWRVIDSADTPEGCWVHFSNIGSDGLGSLTPGDHVTFTYEAVHQDGFDYRTVLVWPPGIKPGTPQRARHHDSPSAAHQSSLTIRGPDGSLTRGMPDRGQNG
jgi:cold shock CspA family protein